MQQSLPEYMEMFLSGSAESLFKINTAYILALFVGFVAYNVYRRGWNTSVNRKTITGSLTSIGIVLCNLAFVPFIFLATKGLQSSYDILGIPSMSGAIWSTMPFWLAGIIALSLHDFVDYWNHRFMHTGLLWPIHAVHHSDEDVNVLTTYRVHFLEAVFMKGTYIFGISWLGFTPEAAAFGGLVFQLHNAYVHADVDWDHGPFKYLIASPRFHRWHHANAPEAFGKNLANIIPAWDYMFGTYYNPKVCDKPMGAEGIPHANLPALMLLPYTLWKEAFLNARKKRQNAKGQQTLDPAE